VHGALALRQALTVSSDVFFYQLGQYMNEKGMPLQLWGHRLGIGDVPPQRGPVRPGVLELGEPGDRPGSWAAESQAVS